MSTGLQQVKTLLQGIREDGTRYDALRHQLEQQRLCMIRRDSDELLAINELIQQHYEQLQKQQPTAPFDPATAGRKRQSCRNRAGL